MQTKQEIATKKAELDARYQKFSDCENRLREMAKSTTKEVDLYQAKDSLSKTQTLAFAIVEWSQSENTEQIIKCAKSIMRHGQIIGNYLDTNN